MNLHPAQHPLPRTGERPEPGLRLHTPAVNSQDLFRGQKAVSIEHNGELYRLQCTRAGKLILTK